MYNTVLAAYLFSKTIFFGGGGGRECGGHYQYSELPCLNCIFLQIGPLLNCIINGRYTETNEDVEESYTETST